MSMIKHLTNKIELIIANELMKGLNNVLITVINFSPIILLTHNMNKLTEKIAGRVVARAVPNIPYFIVKG